MVNDAYEFVMDVMAAGGWLRIQRGNKCFKIRSPDYDFIHRCIVESNIRATICEVVDHGFHMYECSCSVQELNNVMKLLTDMLNCSEAEADLCTGAYAQARAKLFSSLTYPKYNRSEQEYAHGVAIHKKQARTWQCECGREVLCDGLPCFCGCLPNNRKGEKNVR